MNCVLPMARGGILASMTEPGEHVRLTWADHRNPTRAAYQRVGPWPGASNSYRSTTGSRARQAIRRNAPVAGSPSYRHAAETWEAARTAASRAAVGAPPQMADFAMVSALATHLARCDRCHRTGPLDSVTPMAWLTWAVRTKRGLWRIFAPVLAELEVKGRSRLSNPPQLPKPRRRKVKPANP